MADRYAARSPTRILHYRKLLQNTKKNALSVDDYVLKMKDLAGNLAAAGDNVSETDLVMYILRGLGSDFQPISTILEIRPEQYSLEEVQHHLLAFESKLDELNSAINYDATHKAANMVTGSISSSLGSSPYEPQSSSYGSSVPFMTYSGIEVTNPYSIQPSFS
nr:uncharacterized protein LOC125418707 [Ziziphus jujuba var. spinosa]